MLKKILPIFLFFALFLCVSSARSASPSQAKEANINALTPITKEDRILILAPHPDDETIGCAGIIQQAVKVGAKVNIAYLTNGEHNQLAFIVFEKRITFRRGEFIHLGEVRRKEAIKAMKLLGIPKENLVFLGYPDFGTLKIFCEYWQTNRPQKDLMTRISSVPYKENLSFGAPYVGESILKDVKSVILKYRPNKIFVSHPLDTNRDHKALYLFLQIALRDLAKSIEAPMVYPYLIHCAGWPLPRHYHPELRLTPPLKFANSEVNWARFELIREQIENKYKAILCYKSQTESSAFYLLSFARQNELFGDYAPIELKKQFSLKEKAVSFFGFSGMYPDADFDAQADLETISGNEGSVSYAILDNYFLMRIEKTKTSMRKLSFMLYLFGYSDKIPFRNMPKIRIVTKGKRFKIFNCKKMIKPEGVSLEINKQGLLLKVPLELLGDPDFLLTSVRAYGHALPVDATGFRKIEIKE